MPIKKTQNVHGFYVEIDKSLFAQLEAFRKTRREERRKVLEQSLRRHMENPPPLVPDPPLPPAPSKDNTEPKPAKKKGK